MHATPITVKETPAVRRTWGATALDLPAALRPVAPAVVLLWLPAVIGSLGGIPGAVRPWHTALSIPALMVGGLAPLWVAAGWARLRGRSFRGMVRLLVVHGWLGPRLVRFLVLAPTLTVFFGSFAKWKSAIPLLYPGFSWDAQLETAEVWLHGDHPDRLLTPLLGTPEAILFLDRTYHTWFYMLFALVIWQAWEGDHRRACHFWTSFALTWIMLGIFMASWFASAGPIYAGLDRASPIYDDLIARLDAAEALGPLYVRISAWSLWQAAQQPGVSVGDGISAFPSLHVAIAAVGTFALWRVHPVFGLAGAGYALLILVGSVMLGWHYALDGEVSILGAAVIWLASGWLARRSESSAPASTGLGSPSESAGTP